VFPLKDNIPTDRLPVVTIALIVANVVVYLLLQRGGWEITSPTSGTWSFQQEAAYPCDLANRCDPPPGHVEGWVSVLTSMFMHGGLLHLGGNMLFLWIFGNNVEDSMGPVKFILFYVLGGLAADAGQIAFSVNSTVPSIGASGAVAAILGGYLLLFPRARVITVIFIVFFFTILELPALVILGFWFVQQLLFGYFDLNTAGASGGVAYFAHVGGFAFGLLAVKLFADERKQRQQLAEPRF
jgi:membrane associated rhomboid family serine protease